jgi:prevent-host-death family protein
MKVSVEEAQRRFDELLDRAAIGDDVVITDNNEPVARLVSIPAPKGKSKKRQLGSAKGEFTVPSDFNDPPPKE